MSVVRIVPNIGPLTPEMRRFYGDLLGLDVAMDLDWIATLQGTGEQAVQLSIANEGGGGLALPALSIEVSDVDAMFAKMTAAKVPIDRALQTEPWGVRRFLCRDPNGTLINILAH